MRLSELNKPKELSDFRNDYRNSKSKQVRLKLQAYLKKGGFKKLGSGAFGVVYAHPDYADSVFKIFQNDVAFTRWIEVSRQMAKHNPFYPKFKTGPIKIIGDIYMVRMEKLKYNREDGNDYRSTSFVRDYFREMIATLTGGKGGSTDNVRHRFEDKFPEYERFIYDEKFDEVMYDIMETADWVGGKIDLHSGNFMWRGDQLVFTDPVAKIGKD